MKLIAKNVIPLMVTMMVPCMIGVSGFTGMKPAEKSLSFHQSSSIHYPTKILRLAPSLMSSASNNVVAPSNKNMHSVIHQADARWTRLEQTSNEARECTNSGDHMGFPHAAFTPTTPTFSLFVSDVWGSSSANIQDLPIPEDNGNVLLVSTSSQTITNKNWGGTNANSMEKFLKKAKLRLFTQEDKFGLHKITGVGQTLLGAAIFGIGASNSFEELPQTLEPLTAAFNGIILLQLGTSVQLAFSHRRREAAIRNAFVTMALGSFVSSIAAYFIAPFCPDWLSDPATSKSLFFILDICIFALSVDGIMSSVEAIDMSVSHDERRKLHGFSKDLVWLQNALALLPFAAMVPISFIILVTVGLYCDRACLLTLLDSEHVTGMGQAGLYYGQIASCIAFGYISFFATLRDKHLINSETFVTLSASVGLILAFAQFEPCRFLLQSMFM